MGSSEKAGNKGIPATSRNGAPIEMTAILAACLDFVVTMYESGKFMYNGVEFEDGFLSYNEWRN